MTLTRTLPLFAAITLLLSSCASIVRHPEVDPVKKIAIVSLYSNQTILKVGGGGSVGGGADFLKKAIGTKDEDNSDNSNRVRLAKYALDKYREVLNKVPGWEVIPNETVVALAEYQKLGEVPEAGAKLSKAIDFAVRLQQAKYNTPPKMWAIQLSEKDRNSAQVEKLAKLCAKLGVDAVAVVDLDLAYEAGFFSIGGNGAAKASVASSVKVLNRDGKFAVVFPDIAPAAGTRFTSERPVTMIGGKLLMMGEVEKAFHEAIDKAALNTIEVIKEGLAKK